jgi:Fusaric acid resistance protein-like
VAKSGLAAGLGWGIAQAVTGAPDPVLAPLTALVVVQVSVRASIRTALQRSAAVVLGVLLAAAVGNALDLNGLTVALIVAISLGVAELVLRLPRAAARQVPISFLVVLSAVASNQEGQAGRRALDTVLGAAVGVAISLLLPASRLVDARQTLQRLADGLDGVLEAMGAGLQQPWSTDQTEAWRRTARTVRDRLVDQAAEAVGDGRGAARWNVRDRRHIDVLGRFEDVMPRLERTAIGVSVIARGLDDHAHLTGTTHRAMPAMGALLTALASAVRALVDDVLGGTGDGSLPRALAEVRTRRDRCMRGASRRARVALEHGKQAGGDQLEGEWLGYAALLVQVDRIVGDLSAPVPS